MGYLSRKEEIVLTTISLIHEIGVSNISMKEIARREGVTEASLYKHYKSKDDLIGAVMKHYEHFDTFIYNTLIENEEKAVNNIVKYFTIYAEYYSNYKEITALIYAYDVLVFDKNFSNRASELIWKKTEFIKNLVKQAQDEEELVKDISLDSMAYILLGSFNRVITMWRLMDYTFSLVDKTAEIVGDIIQAYKIKEGNN